MITNSFSAVVLKYGEKNLASTAAGVVNKKSNFNNILPVWVIQHWAALIWYVSKSRRLIGRVCGTSDITAPTCVWCACAFHSWLAVPDIIDEMVWHFTFWLIFAWLVTYWLNEAQFFSLSLNNVETQLFININRGGLIVILFPIAEIRRKKLLLLHVLRFTILCNRVSLSSLVTRSI